MNIPEWAEPMPEELMPTPRTNTVAKQLGQLSAKWAGGDIDMLTFVKLFQVEMDKLAQLERELHIANIKLVELEKDAARLDWFDNHHVSVETFINLAGENDIRHAIDKAMAAQKG